MTLTFSENKSTGFEVYDLLQDSQWSVIELQMIDKRVEDLDDMLTTCDFSRQLYQNVVIPSEFVVSNDKLYLLYEETGPTLESLSGDWGFKNGTNCW